MPNRRQVQPNLPVLCCSVPTDLPVLSPQHRRQVPSDLIQPPPQLALAPRLSSSATPTVLSKAASPKATPAGISRATAGTMSIAQTQHGGGFYAGRPAAGGF